MQTFLVACYRRLERCWVALVFMEVEVSLSGSSWMGFGCYLGLLDGILTKPVVRGVFKLFRFGF